jgi:hypothetical protein
MLLADHAGLFGPFGLFGLFGWSACGRRVRPIASRP